MTKVRGTGWAARRGAVALAMVGALAALGSPASAQGARPNSQNLMQGPSSWTPQQRRLNIPGANANPSLKRQTLPYAAPQRVEPQSPPRPAETPVPAETPKAE